MTSRADGGGGGAGPGPGRGGAEARLAFARAAGSRVQPEGSAVLLGRLVRASGSKVRLQAYRFPARVFFACASVSRATAAALRRRRAGLLRMPRLGKLSVPAFGQPGVRAACPEVSAEPGAAVLVSVMFNFYCL